MLLHPDHMIITDECINCGECVPACPKGAISEGNYGKYIVDSSKVELVNAKLNHLA